MGERTVKARGRLHCNSTPKRTRVWGRWRWVTAAILDSFSGIPFTYALLALTNGNMPHQVLARGEEVRRWGMELKAKGVLVHGNIDNRCLRVEHHQDSHANARPAKQRLCMWRFFLSLEDRHCSLESVKTGSRALKQKLITLALALDLCTHHSCWWTIYLATWTLAL
ncbi:hypothetical protein NC651_021637 [Populus alba x Populus x berolinensis]|nr:hypothetical protein NC651_021637 [Populus alba x Populus x berolinensis]